MLPNYEIHKTYGVLNQIERKPYNYSAEYVHAYDALPCRELSKIRYDNIISVVGKTPNSILDVGYGNGAFIEYCIEQNVPDVFGFDVAPTEPPINSTKVRNIEFGSYQVITFFDSLEHMNDIGEVIQRLADTEYVVISLPQCREYDSMSKNPTYSDEWFSTYKHRKVDEHLWYFSKISLFKFMAFYEYDCMSMNNCEDAIRKPVDNEGNILTAIFKKRKENFDDEYSQVKSQVGQVQGFQTNIKLDHNEFIV